MFKAGDMLVFSNFGVCEVVHVGSLDMDGISKDRLYYTLKPHNGSTSTLYSPVDNDNDRIRPVMDREGALEFLREIRDIGYLAVSDERRREDDYKEALHSCDCREIIRLIRTVSQRIERRNKLGKSPASIDRKYFEFAQDQLCEELEVSLGMTREEVKDCIAAALAA